MALVKGQQYTPAQIYAEDPNWLKVNNPSAYAQFTQQIGQPAAGLTGQNLSNAGQAIELPAKQASADVQVQTAPAQISTANSDAIVADQKAKAARFLLDVTTNFAKAKKDNGGKVPAPYYNEVKSEAPQFGIDSASFDGAFRTNNVDTSHEINYNTDQGAQQQQDHALIKRGLQAQIDAYNSIPNDQKGVFSKSAATKIPGSLKQILAPQATEYENQLGGLSTKLGGIAGVDSGGSLRISQAELNNWSDLMPSPTKSKKQNDYDLTQLNRLLEAKFGKGNGLDGDYLPGAKQTTTPQTQQGAWQ